MSLKFRDLDKEALEEKARVKKAMADEPEIKTVTFDDIPEILSKQIAKTNEAFKMNSMEMLHQILANQNVIMVAMNMTYAKKKED